jgi:Tol biopolymer transport system component
MIGAALLATFSARASHSACNVIPPAIRPFRSNVAAIDRPFAGPGDWLELSPDPCGSASGLEADLDDLVVSVLFTPPRDGPITALVLTSDDCDDPATQSRLQACVSSLPPGGRAVCRALEQSVERPRGKPAALRLRFPDTDDLLGAEDDDDTLTGPATIAVTRRADAFPCNLVRTDCASVDAASCGEVRTDCAPRPGLLACVNQLLSDGTCAQVPHPQFSHFSALPPPNDYAALCTSPAFPDGPCTGEAMRTARMTVDTSGNLLIPVDWSGVLFRRTEVPVPRLLDAASMVTAFERIDGVLQVPNAQFLASFSPEGRRLPPLFEQQTDTTDDGMFRLFGSADAARTVLRVASRGPTGRCARTARECHADFECPVGERCRRYGACSSGPLAGLPCSGVINSAECGGSECAATTCTVCAAGPRSGLACRTRDECNEPSTTSAVDCVPGALACSDDDDCPQASCGPSLFDFGDRLTDDVGPVRVTDVVARAGDPVPLTGLVQRDDRDLQNVFVRDERIEDANLNGDGDVTDPVLTIQDRSTGIIRKIGQNVGTEQSVGRAVARVALGSFSFPGVAVERDVVAFLEPEPLQNGIDTNGNGRIFETVLRVVAVDRDMSSEAPTIDAEPILDGRSVAISEGVVWFRSHEGDVATRALEGITAQDFRTETLERSTEDPSLSANAGVVSVVSSVAFAPEDTNDVADVYVRDLSSGNLMLASVSTSGGAGDGPSTRAVLAASGDSVVFESNAANLVANDTNAAADIFSRDLLGGVTRLSIGPAGIQGNGGSFRPAVSGDGRLVAFRSAATNLVPGDDNVACVRCLRFDPFDECVESIVVNCEDVFVHDRLTGETTRISVASDGTQGDGEGFASPDLSADGRFVVFDSAATNLVAEDTNARSDVFVHDRVTGVTTRVSIASDGTEGSGSSFEPSISDDGVLVAFSSDALEFDGSENNFAAAIFVHDRSDGTTTRISIPTERFRSAGRPRISRGGRFVAYNVARTSFIEDTYVHDRVNGTTRLVAEATDRRDFGPVPESLSGDGRVIAFDSARSDLVSGDDNEATDAFVLDLGHGGIVRIGGSHATTELAPSSSTPLLSPNGRLVVFASDATNLVPDDTNEDTDVFVRDRSTGQIARVNVTVDGRQAENDNRPGSLHPYAFSGDGRLLAFESDDKLVPEETFSTDIFVRDLVTFDLEKVSVASNGAEGDGDSSAPAMSADGRFVAFQSNAFNFGGTDYDFDDIFVHDRRTGETTRISRPQFFSELSFPSPGSIAPSISADGRIIAYESLSSTLVERDTNDDSDIFVHDRTLHTTVRINLTVDGGETEGRSYNVSMSSDGRYVAYDSAAVDLVPGDTNDSGDVFVYDRATATTSRISIASDGTQGNDSSFLPRISADGRFVAFYSIASNLVAATDTNGATDAFLHDRVTGSTVCLSLKVDGSFSTGGISFGSPPTLSDDGRTAAFESLAADLIPGDRFENEDIVVTEPRTDPGADATGDGDVDDAVLRAMDVRNGAGPVTIAPAGRASISGSTAAFLRPEAADASDLNGDGDITDRVVHVAGFGTPLRNLGRSGVDVALSADTLAALISERDDGDRDLTGDRDRDDDVVAVRRLDEAAWTDLGIAAASFRLAGNVVAFLAPVRKRDRVETFLHVYDIGARRFVLGGGAAERGEPAIDFVIGGEPGRELVAFRANEKALRRDGDGDGDREDDVLRVFDRARAVVIDTGQAVRPCRIEACDPREPFRVDRNTATFLSFEGDVRRDLDGDGDDGDLVVQTIDVRNVANVTSRRRVLAAVKAGICTGSSLPCLDNRDCGNEGACFVPPGGCLKALGTACMPCDGDASCSTGCASDAFCAPTPGAPGEGTCIQRLRPFCSTDGECRDQTLPGSDPSATCNASDQRFQRVVGPLTRVGARSTAGAKVFVSSGRCVEDTGVVCDPTAGAGRTGCRSGFMCQRVSEDTSTATCQREQRVCTTDDDCPRASSCRQELVTATANDSDGDEITDVTDNCPELANSDQTDRDADGAGDACDPSTGSCGSDASLPSIRCRAIDLVDSTVGRIEIATIRETLRTSAEQARAQLAIAGQEGRRGQNALRRAERRLTSYRHRLRSLAGRRKIAKAVRDDLLGSAEALRSDIRGLRRTARVR